MISSRRGLSDIVTNVLIILLVLVAIGIIWAFVRPTINQGAGQLDGASDCLTVDVQAISCAYDDADGSTDISYRRNVGTGTVQEIKFILKEANGNSQVQSSMVIPAELETETTSLTFASGLTGPLTIDTAVVVQIASDPAGKTCPERAAPITCTIV